MAEEEDTGVKEYEERSKRSLDMHKSKRYVGKKSLIKFRISHPRRELGIGNMGPWGALSPLYRI